MALQRAIRKEVAIAHQRLGIYREISEEEIDDHVRLHVHDVLGQVAMLARYDREDRDAQRSNATRIRAETAEV